MRRDVGGVHGDGEVHAFQEVLFGDWGNGDIGCRVGHAAGVLVGAEDGDFLVTGEAEAFYAFVGLLPVVESGCHAVNAEEGVGVEGRGAPLLRYKGVVGLDVAVNY